MITSRSNYSYEIIDGTVTYIPWRFIHYQSTLMTEEVVADVAVEATEEVTAEVTEEVAAVEETAVAAE